MTRTRWASKAVSLLLVLCMAFSLMAVPVFATEQEADTAEETAAEAVSEASVQESDEAGESPALPDESGEPAAGEEPEPAEDPEEETLVTDYSVFLSALQQLEQYADTYVREHAGEESVALVINFIRTGVEKYNSGTWNTFCGEEKTAFTAFVAEQDALNGTNAMCLKDLGLFTVPNGNEVEFSHMFGCMDMAYHTGNQATADLGSWAGDLCDLVQLSQNYGVTGTVEEMAEQIRTDNEHLFLYDNPKAHSFGQKDLYGDLDAFYILSRLGEGKSVSSIMKSYFTKDLNDSFRAAYFLEHRLGGANTKTDIRSAVFEIYSGNEGIRTLEGTYLENGVNPDIRKACCYAFADYLYLTAQDRLDNPYYTVFSSEKSNIAPGVTQEIKMAMSADNKQMVYYLATADVARSDVSVYANYGDNDGSTWKMARVSDQVAAAQAKHSNPDDAANYIPNYNAVASVNADFYNMSNGAVSGTLIMEGVEYHGITSSNFFGILKDGTPVIGGKDVWNACHDQLQEAVGASIWLVKNGKIAVTATSNYYNNRASRTAVGITYDGKVVLMVLDGRQEPWSCGGSSIEIAQIMLDAGCVQAVNLDGGGSTTYVAKPEGAENPLVINRPSDGFERSVSSSLLVVSTAKPSNVFDHAVVSADYDYLTVGTELEIDARGVTATGGAIDLPEGAALQVSDESVGTLNGDVFTANALGDVQLQVVSADGAVLGSKLLHVVQPTELKFTRDSLNVVYGEPETMPLEATYDGKLVKINPNDVAFGYLKISLQSIGNIEGGDVNTTRTELVFDYPEAGSMSGFDFTGNEAGGVRTLTVGAVLATKLNEFQSTVTSEFMTAYQKALADGFTNQQAQLIAEEVAVNKALETAASIKLYLYSADEANFDFSQETGSDGLLHWKREVSNSRYQREINMYYRLDPAEPMVTSYTFAVDMSKMPIPEKLTGLLYMLPGGDQEGRTAWSFLLQLAERISPLTNVTVDIHIPDGFDVDYSDLKIVNEYFDLTSIKYQDNTLKLTANFKLQTEPINPTTANPLCVVSGLKLTPNDEAAWDAVEPDQLNVEVSGELNYDIYAHFHVLKSLASQEEYQVNYGLFPYDNSANLAQDYGAHFSSASDKPIEFTDQYRLNRMVNDGWTRDNGVWKFYEDGAALTGVHQLLSYEGDGANYFYSFDENGVLQGKYTGLAEVDGVWYYPVNGTPATGWREIDGEYYYFHSKTGEAQTGSRTFFSVANYTFDDNGRVHGVWVPLENGTRYYYGPGYYRADGKAGTTLKLVEIDGRTYGLDNSGYRYEGICAGRMSNGPITLYDFSEDGVLNGVVQETGLVLAADGKLYYVVGDGVCEHAGLIEIDGDYYYIDKTCTAVTGTKEIKANWTNGLKPAGTYEFGPDGKMIIKNGLVQEDDGLYWYVDGAKAHAGLIEIDGDYYYIDKTGKAVTGTKTIKADWTNGLKPAGTYEFGPDGKMIIKNGLVQEEDGLYWYVDGQKTHAGLILVDGYYYYIDKTCKAVTGTKRILADWTNGLLPAGTYVFGEDGKMEIAMQKLDLVDSSVAFMENVESKMVDVVMKALRSCVTEIGDKTMVVEIVKKTLGAVIRTQRQVTLKVAPDMVDTVKAQVSSLCSTYSTIETFDVVEDPRLKGAACILETEAGVADASVETQLAAIERSLKKHFSKEV